MTHRYRWATFFIDAMRAPFLGDTPEAEKARAWAEVNPWLQLSYGHKDLDHKFTRWVELRPPNLALPGEYHNLLREVEAAFIHGDFYPALTGSVCLGERISNDLITELKAEYTASPRYKEVARKDSVADWDTAISILEDWGVLRPDAARAFRALARLRNPAVHYGDVGDRLINAREAIALVYDITRALFGESTGRFFSCSGELYVKKDREGEPFTKKFIVPLCHRLGYRHTAEAREGTTVLVESQTAYAPRELTDEEFCDYRRAWRDGVKDLGSS